MTLKQPITNYVHAWLLSLQKRPRRWPSPKRRSSSAIRCPAHPLPSWKLLLPIATLHYCDGSQLGSSACPHTATWNLAVLASSWLCITLGILSSHGGWGPPDRGKWKFQHHTQSASRVGRRFGGCSCHSQILPEKQSPPFLAQSSKLELSPTSLWRWMPLSWRSFCGSGARWPQIGKLFPWTSWKNRQGATIIATIMQCSKTFFLGDLL